MELNNKKKCVAWRTCTKRSFRAPIIYISPIEKINNIFKNIVIRFNQNVFNNIPTEKMTILNKNILF